MITLATRDKRPILLMEHKGKKVEIAIENKVNPGQLIEFLRKHLAEPGTNHETGPRNSQNHNDLKQKTKKIATTLPR